MEIYNASDLYLLPSREEAERLSVAEKHRQQGTINLLLAKYDGRRASAGAKCQVLDLREEFAQVQTHAGQLSGWLPAVDLRPDAK